MKNMSELMKRGLSIQSEMVMVMKEFDVVVITVPVL